jgi:ankyrin repeat protein
MMNDVLLTFVVIVILGWTPLHEAANHGHYHMAQLLVKHGANVMATGFDDVTPLHDAAMFGNQKLVKMLVEKGADPQFKNKKGKTPQEVAHHSLANFFKTTIGESNHVNLSVPSKIQKITRKLFQIPPVHEKRESMTVAR